jgi:ABC-2 type transport system permease protein
MSNLLGLPKNPVKEMDASNKVLPVWWLVFKREMEDLWIGGKALILMLIYSIILGVTVYVYCFNSELILTPPREATYEILKNAMSISLFIALVIGADSLSGERDRGTLESLLLTPANRRQIIAGKFLAGLSQWPAAFLIILPFIKLLSQLDQIFLPALIWGALTGTILVIGYTCLGMLVSFWSATNKTSYFFSLGIYILFLIPAQLPGRAETSEEGQFFQWVNPLASINHFLSNRLVNYRPVDEYWTWLVTPAVFSIVTVLLLFLYAAPGLRLEPGKRARLYIRSFRSATSVFLAGMTFVFLAASPVLASPGGRQSMDGLQLSIDTEAREVKTGDAVEYNTHVTNSGVMTSPPLIVAMNIVNIHPEGDVVDPEDWSPQRTQYIDALTPGESASHHWVIDPILDGDFMVYMVLIPAPSSGGSTSVPVVTSGMHLTVTPFTRFNPWDVLPYAIGVPLFLGIVLYFVYRSRSRQIDAGA